MTTLEAIIMLACTEAQQLQLKELQKKGETQETTVKTWDLAQKYAKMIEKMDQEVMNEAKTL